jgi:hypothetical protein
MKSIVNTKKNYIVKCVHVLFFCHASSNMAQNMGQTVQPTHHVIHHSIVSSNMLCFGPCHEPSQIAWPRSLRLYGKVMK